MLSRESLANSIPISAYIGEKLQILVENQGRINFKIANDTKGIIGDVLFNNKALKVNWTITGFPFEDANQLNVLIANEQHHTQRANNQSDSPSIDIHSVGPALFHGIFNLTKDQIADTFINTEKWGKVNAYYEFSMILIAVYHFHFFSFVSGSNFHQWIQFREILESSRTTISIISTKRVITRRK